MAAIDIAKQNETLSRLKDELERLNAKFDESKKALGIEGEVTIDPAEMTPELEKVLEVAREKAQKEARNATAALTSETPSEPAPARRARRGALSI